MSKTFVYDRLDVLAPGDEFAMIERSDGPYVLAEDAINREAVLQDEIKTLRAQLKDAQAQKVRLLDIMHRPRI